MIKNIKILDENTIEYETMINDVHVINLELLELDKTLNEILMDKKDEEIKYLKDLINKLIER